MDEFLGPVRAAVEADKALPSVPIQEVDEIGATANHLEALLLGNYARNPEAGRPGLLAWYDRMLHRTGMNARNESGIGSEVVSTSHAAHYIGTRGAALLLTLRNGDEPVLDGVCEVIGRELCHWGLLRHPKSGRIIGAGDRNTFEPKGRDRSDQRVQMAAWYAQIMGLRWREPDGLATADDWLGAFAVKKASVLPGFEAALGKIRSYQGQSGLPLMHEQYVVRRGPGGLSAFFADESRWPGMVGAALWARSDFGEPVVKRNVGNTPDEEYGFAGPVPDCPGGGEIREYRLPWIGDKHLWASSSAAS